ncbi:N-acetyltransferase [Chitinophaga silvatica]|uniref:N-acetyltransferase n=1 Tax=Chitinophaga silvatica TaxID=2282649 RepID=A0A3E1YHV2_9BACT|nr:GNAT family N-acetyltransferase [Chitinophaga silvatica]RFS26928.1 N-acetyltransferase [Chitinophaga silvatica]
MQFSIQPILENEKVKLVPLQEDDFEALYAVASDKKIWEQHPNKDRWQKTVFQSFFEGALKSGGAFKIIDKSTGEIAGSTRYYDYDENHDSIMIGYTFYATRYWGSGINPSVKRLMLDYIFQYVSHVLFHIGASNLRSQIAITRIGAVKVGEETVAYYGEPSRLNFVYEIRKSEYRK